MNPTAKNAGGHRDERPPVPVWDPARRQIENGMLSIIMPAHNLGPIIAESIKRVHAVFAGQLPFEIVAIDDGSDDNTQSELERIQSAIPELHSVRINRNTGKGAALRNGFQVSRGSFILFLDADLELPPSQASLFFKIMEDERADVVIGSKRHPNSVLEYPWHRRLVSTCYFALVKLLFGLPIRDTQTGMKLFKRAPLEWAFPRLLVKRFAFDLELLAVIHRKSFRIAESPVELQYRGKTGCVSYTNVKTIALDTLAVFYRLRILRYYQAIRHTRMPEPLPLVSIVVAFPTPTRYLEECLGGIGRQTYKQYEVILLPDEPSGREWPEGVRELPTGRRRPAEKRNAGIERARGKIVAFLDDDAFPGENWLDQAVVYFSDNTVAAVGGPAESTSRDPYLAVLSGCVYANPLVSGKYRYRYMPERVREVEDYPSCNLLVRSEVLRQLGGFRTDFWPGEDTYLCLEIVKKLKMKIMYDPRVNVHHHRRRLFLPHLRQVGRYALHRGYFARRFPETSRKPSYMLPSIFVIGLVSGGIASLVSTVVRAIYVPALLLYVTVTFLSCASSRPAKWLLTWLGVMLTHIVYGIRFLVGLCSRRMPEEVRPFDHPSEEQEGMCER